MTKKIKKHVKRLPSLLIVPEVEEELHENSGDVQLNINSSDRISFSVLKNKKNKLRKIQNISYEVLIENKWEWVVRYDDHGGLGPLHRHFRISLLDESQVESAIGIKKYQEKNYEVTWVFKDIKRNYLSFRETFLKNNGLDLY